MKSGKTYLVDVEAYEKHIYGIKFYLKSQAHLQEKYSFQTNDFEPKKNSVKLYIHHETLL